MRTTAGPWSRWPRILAEDLCPLIEPLGALLAPGPAADPAAVARGAARALIEPGDDVPDGLAHWLQPHQRPAVRRLGAIVRRYGGAVLADAVGLGKSFIALAVARALRDDCLLVVPAVLVHQWRDLLVQLGVSAPLVSHERLSGPAPPRFAGEPGLLIVDEAHRFRDPTTRRYGAVARIAEGRRVLLVTATPVHNRTADLLHLLRLFLTDDALTALGVPSLHVAAREGAEAVDLRAAVARLVVARSRERARVRATGLAFPRRGAATVVRAGTAPDDTVAELVAAIRDVAAGGRARGLVRLLLYSRLASSLPAFRGSAARLEAFAAAAAEAASTGRTLAPHEFSRWFPAGEAGDVQLALLPLLATAGPPVDLPDQAALRALVARASAASDPKAQALDRILTTSPEKTIVFTGARATARHLARLLGRRHRVALVTAAGGAWGAEPASREEVLRAFAPLASGSPAPPAALATDVLIATDLLSEGLNLQDAARVVHYDVPWSPARLAQRVGRIDRLGSRHAAIETVTFLPPEPLAGAIASEARLARKAALQWSAGAAALETPTGATTGAGALDWCDRLQELGEQDGLAAPAGAWCAVADGPRATVLVLRFGGPGGPVDALVVDQEGCRADADRATRLLESAGRAPPVPADGARAVSAAIAAAADVVRTRLRALEQARWRAADRDGPGRRLVPWVLAAARRAARGGDTRRLARLDALVARLTHGLTAGAELLLRDLLERRRPLRVDDVLAWHERLPAPWDDVSGPAVELVAAAILGWRSGAPREAHAPPRPPPSTFPPCASPPTCSTSTER
jgi:superfamily II DNA or RNA helicase